MIPWWRRTSAGPLLAPTPYRQQGEAAAEPELSRHDSPSSLGNLPQLRISGEALKKLVAEGGGGKTWPKTRSEQGSGRPPLPFRASQPARASPRGQAPQTEEPAYQSSQVRPAHDQSNHHLYTASSCHQDWFILLLCINNTSSPTQLPTGLLCLSPRRLKAHAL